MGNLALALTVRQPKTCASFKKHGVSQGLSTADTTAGMGNQIYITIQKKKEKKNRKQASWANTVLEFTFSLQFLRACSLLIHSEALFVQEFYSVSIHTCLSACSTFKGVSRSRNHFPPSSASTAELRFMNWRCGMLSP